MRTTYIMLRTGNKKKKGKKAEISINYKRNT